VLVRLERSSVRVLGEARDFFLSTEKKKKKKKKKKTIFIVAEHIITGHQVAVKILSKQKVKTLKMVNFIFNSVSPNFILPHTRLHTTTKGQEN
jgi:nucleoside permease NupC